jgi:hypothetical protein
MGVEGQVIRHPGRTAHNRAVHGYRERDGLMFAWALGNTLSRRHGGGSRAGSRGRTGHRAGAAPQRPGLR